MFQIGDLVKHEGTGNTIWKIIKINMHSCFVDGIVVFTDNIVSYPINYEHHLWDECLTLFELKKSEDILKDWI